MAKKEKPAGWRPKPTYLAAWRKRAGMERQDVADKMEVSHTTIGRLENGDIEAYNAYYLEVLADLYGCKRGDLLDTNPEAAADEEARLRSALVAYGVDRDNLPAVMRAISGFVDDSVEQRRTDQPHGQSAPANPLHEEEQLG